MGFLSVLLQGLGETDRLLQITRNATELSPTPGIRLSPMQNV